MSDIHRIAGNDEGQMVVEMAVVAPVMIVVAVVVLNLMWFLEAAARFDRVALDEVLALAVSPAGEYAAQGGEREVENAIRDAMGSLRGVEVDVRTAYAWEVSEGFGFSFAPHLTRYVCTMRYTPWPQGLQVAGIDAGVPFELVHERSIVVDCYRPGVVF